MSEIAVEETDWAAMLAGEIMSSDTPTYAEVGEQNVRERYGPVRRIKDMGEREDEKDAIV